MSNLTINLTLTDREADIVRRALMMFAEYGADGCTTECMDIRMRIIEGQFANDMQEQQGEDSQLDNDDRFQEYEDHMTEPTVAVQLTEQDLRIIRRSIPYFTTVGAEGETTAAWELRQRIIEAEDRLLLQNPPDFEEQHDDGMTDVEADANTLASAGWGTDEDYGYFGDDE